MKPIKVEKYREKLYRTCIKGGTWRDVWGKWDIILRQLSEINNTSSDNAMDWIDTILHQFGEEVKDECMNAVDEAIAKDDNDTTKIIDSIRQNVIIK